MCPSCATPVEGESLAGIWSGFDRERNRGINGPGYTAICKKCGANLYSLPTKEEAGARQFFWEIHERPRKQHREEKLEQEAILMPLLQAHAQRAEVVRNLGLQFTDYSVGSSNHLELQKWLFLDEVDEAATRYPGILFHMNSRTMTWLFFDVENRLQGYFIRSA